ncbi:hypothetical protein, partial [Alkalibacillus haloalkaliphilus]|uniref:hypothetical protein n=1 Tax=Alkalibacillus haloalkaliphilus TaxID=94136 RepID=UPI00293586D0
AMQRLSTRSGLYPICYNLEQVEVDRIPIAAGGFADIYRGRFQDQPVCLKAIRVYQTTQIDYFLKVLLVFTSSYSGSS